MLREGYKQMISFYNEGKKQIFFREIVYPVTDSEMDIYHYFLDSISYVSFLCVGEPEKCVYQVLDKRRREKQRTKIDHYWIDGDVYLVEYLKNGTTSFITIVADNCLTDFEIKTLINQSIENISIKFMDKMNTCWIKKSEY